MATIPSDFNPAMLIYLNPELITTGPEDVFLRWPSTPSWHSLAYSVPPLPHGFDPHVYLATRIDVSGINRSIQLAMERDGMPPGNSRFINTMGAAPATLIAPNIFQTTFPISSCNLQPGDLVRVDIPRVGFVDGSVTDVASNWFRLSNSCYQVDDVNAEYRLFGIQIHDPLRQALVSLSRASSNSIASTSPNESRGDANSVVIDQSFQQDTYSVLYPDSRSLSYDDAYLDRVGRWSRDSAYRALTGDDLLNTRAPFNNLCNLGVTALGVGMSNPDPSLGTAVAVKGDIFTTGMVITQSDERTKDGLERVDHAIDRIRMLHGYTYLTDGTRRHTGLLAQDVLKAMPEAVYSNSDSNLYSVAYGNLAGLFAEAIKEIASKLDSLSSSNPSLLPPLASS